MINNYMISLVKHSEISDLLIDEIINLKQQHWPYSYKSQIDWINTNISGDDYHLLILDSKDAIFAYMNLVNRRVNFMPILGVGNVCVHKAMIGSDIGKLLMNICKHFSKQLSLDLVLLCKMDLALFYKKCGFYQYRNKVYIDGVLFNKCVMFSNDNYKSVSEISINRNF